MRNSRTRSLLLSLVLAAAANPSPPAPAAAASYHHRYHRHHDAEPPAALPVDQAAPGVHTTVYFPTLEVNAWPAPVLPMGRTDMSTWPLLIDVDHPSKFERWRDRVTGAWRTP